MESFYLWDINRGLEDLLNFGQQTTNNYPFFLHLIKISKFMYSVCSWLFHWRTK